MKVTRVKCAPIRTLALLPAGSLVEEKPDWLLRSDGTLQVFLRGPSQRVNMGNNKSHM